MKLNHKKFNIFIFGFLIYSFVSIFSLQIVGHGENKLIKEDNNQEFEFEYFYTSDPNPTIYKKITYKKQNDKKLKILEETCDHNGNIINSKLIVMLGDYETIRYKHQKTYNATYNDKNQQITKRILLYDENISYEHPDTWNREYYEQGNIIKQRHLKNENEIDWLNKDTWNREYDKKGNIIKERHFKNENEINWLDPNNWNGEYDEQGNIIKQRYFKNENEINWFHPNTWNKVNNEIIKFDLKDTRQIKNEKLPDGQTKKVILNLDNKPYLEETFNQNQKIIRSRVFLDNGVVNWQHEKTFDIKYNSNGKKNKKIKFSKENTPIEFLSDIFLDDKIREELEDLANYLTDYKEYQKKNIKIPKGYILHGPPGTGKTYIMKKLSKFLNVPLLYKNSTEFKSAYIGEGEKEIRNLFEEAFDKKEPCIIFIDEIDVIASKRTSNTTDARDASGRSHNGLVAELLMQIDGFHEHEYPVFVIGATNMFDTLDPAIIRPGRLDKHILFDLPNKRDCFKMLEKLLQQNKEIEPHLLNDKDFLEDLALKCFEAKMSQSGLDSLIQEAKTIAFKNDDDLLKKEHINKALSNKRISTNTNIRKYESFLDIKNFYIIQTIIMLILSTCFIITLILFIFRYLPKNKKIFRRKK